MQIPVLASYVPGVLLRFVANSVTLETETILQDARNEYGGNLIRFDISTARAIGSKNLWQPAYPITQWSIEK